MANCENRNQRRLSATVILLAGEQRMCGIVTPAELN
jgi:hypothetical protein